MLDTQNIAHFCVDKPNIIHYNVIVVIGINYEALKRQRGQAKAQPH